MRAVVPAAGQVTGLFPQTHTEPKPMARAVDDRILGRTPSALVAEGSRRGGPAERYSERPDDFPTEGRL